MEESVRSAVTSFSMNERLLKILPQRGDSAYQALVGALKYMSGQLHLVDLLEETPISLEGMFLPVDIWFHSSLAVSLSSLA